MIWEQLHKFLIPKTMAIASPTTDDGSGSAVSSIQNSSSIHKAKVSASFTLDAKKVTKDKFMKMYH